MNRFHYMMVPKKVGIFGNTSLFGNFDGEVKFYRIEDDGLSTNFGKIELKGEIRVVTALADTAIESLQAGYEAGYEAGLAKNAKK